MNVGAAAAEGAAAAAMNGGDPMRPRPYRVQKVERETSDTFTMHLVPEMSQAAFPFKPGQFNMLYAHGAGEVPISISGDPTLPQVLVHTTRAVGAVTKALGRLEKGDSLGVRGPFGTAWPVEEAEGSDIVFVAGGIGLAPLRPALHHVLEHRGRYGRVVLLYGTRMPEDILYARQLRKWRAELDLDVHVTVDRATRDWRGNVGVVTTLIPRVPFEARQTVALVCGPEMMMRFTVQELERRCVAEDRIHVSLERNMKCAVGLCGHCQLGPLFVCRDGPVFPYGRVRGLVSVREV
ncbi:MAG: FAD/NAD(P)-binding protein [Thermoanaerobaculia bacterium]